MKRHSPMNLNAGSLFDTHPRLMVSGDFRKSAATSSMVICRGAGTQLLVGDRAARGPCGYVNPTPTARRKNPAHVAGLLVRVDLRGLALEDAFGPGVRLAHREVLDDVHALVAELGRLRLEVTYRLVQLAFRLTLGAVGLHGLVIVIPGLGGP